MLHTSTIPLRLGMILQRLCTKALNKTRRQIPTVNVVVTFSSRRGATWHPTDPK